AAFFEDFHRAKFARTIRPSKIEISRSEYCYHAYTLTYFFCELFAIEVSPLQAILVDVDGEANEVPNLALQGLFQIVQEFLRHEVMQPRKPSVTDKACVFKRHFLNSPRFPDRLSTD